MEMRLIKHVLKRSEHIREVPFGADRLDDGHPKNRRDPLKLFTASYATGVATIKAIKDRISAARSERTDKIAHGESSNQPGVEGDSSEQDHPAENTEPCLSLTGRLKEGESSPNDQWKAYSKRYREEHDKQQCEGRIDAKGMEAFRFELIEVDRAWWRMKVGEVPDVATQIWEALEIALPVHIIAEDVQISTRECVFWLTVFKRHLGVQEERQSGRCVYARNPELTDLSIAVEQKVRSVH